jgi:uncharacterized protein (TIGR02646 family)
MKHVPRLSREPTSLTTYRCENDADAKATPSEAQLVWARFRDVPAFGEVREALVAAQGGLCIYCEQRLTNDAGQLVPNDQQLEHVLPKSGGVGRTLDWRNLALCCAGGTYPHHEDSTRRYASNADVSCGQRKDDRELSPNCDPRGFPCLPRLVEVGLDGTLSPIAASCKSVGIDSTQLEETINVTLNLNCERLKVARKKVADNIRAWIVGLAEELLRNSTLTAEQRAAFMTLVAAGRLQPDGRAHLHAFWTTERQYLEPWSETWIASNLSLLGCPAVPDQVRNPK